MTRKKSSARDENAQDLQFTKPIASRLTKDQYISAGANAAQTLENPVVRVVFDLLMEELYTQIALSHPKENQARESAYLQIHSLVRVMEKMQELKNRAEQYVQELQDKPHLEEAEYFNNQGFN